MWKHTYTQVLKQMGSVHLADLVGREWIFVGVNDAHMYCLARMAELVSPSLNFEIESARLGSRPWR